MPNHAADTANAPVQLATAQVAEQGTPPRMLDSGAPFSFAPLVERVSPAVVSVTVEQKSAPEQGAGLPQDIPEPFRQFFRQFGQGAPTPAPAQRKAISMGSGFIIDKDGLIVTNNHVVGNGGKIKVKLADGRTFDAKLLGADAATDVALLKVTPDKPLPTVEFGNDRSLRVGDWVIAVGNPFGLSNTVTAGIVSSIGRDINSAQPYTDFIQIDAPINQGNSGGPTFDLRGQVIGMNSMIYSPTGGSVGIGFAIPASTVRDTIAQLEAHGKVSRGWLGVQIQAVTPDMANSLGLKDAKGAMINSVVAGGPAAKAGLHQGDVVLTIDGKAVEDGHDLQRRVASIAVGSSAEVVILRDGKHKTVKVAIAQRNDQQVAAITQGEPGDAPVAATGKALGMGLAALNDETRRTYSLNDGIHGVIVTKIDPDSDAAEKGLQPGDVIVSVANHDVHTPQDVEKQIAAAKAAGRKNVLLLVANQSGSYFVAVAIKS
ncbi:MAG: DegQ family serine endoprotease [Rhizomicrobium sp.]